MKRASRVLQGVLIGLLLLPVVANAQLRGLARLAGKVADDGGAPLAGVAIKAKLDGYAGTIEGTSDDKGSFAIAGMAKGDWDVMFEKPGYGAGRVKVNIQVEMASIPAVKVTLKKAG